MGVIIKGLLIFALGTWFGAGIMAALQVAKNEDRNIEGE